MRVAVIADTHLPRGSRRLPVECVDRLRRADVILHAGDFVTLGVLRELEQVAPVYGVLGNNDEPELADVLPERRVVELDGVRVGMVHEGGRSAGRAPRLAALFPGCDAVVYAHTHSPEVSREGRAWILNPGSPTERRRASSRAMLELSLHSGDIRPTLVTLSA